MYAGVPRTRPSTVVVVASSSMSRAIPKSSSTGASSTTRMFSGFTSRCTIPAVWSAWSARASTSNHRSAVSAGTGPRRMRAASVSPSRSGIARYGRPSGRRPASRSFTRPGASTRCMRSASSRKRRRSRSDGASSARRTFSARRRSLPSMPDVARTSYTMPLPPSPRTRSGSKRGEPRTFSAFFAPAIACGTLSFPKAFSRPCSGRIGRLGSIGRASHVPVDGGARLPEASKDRQSGIKAAETRLSRDPPPAPRRVQDHPIAPLG